MKTKAIQIKAWINDYSVFAIQHLLDQMSEGEEAHLNIALYDLSQKRLSAFYSFENYEINESFIDEEICADYLSVQSASPESDCSKIREANITGVEISEDGAHILFSVEVPLFASETKAKQSAAPVPLAQPQEVTFTPGTPELQKYSISIVGIRHHASDETYATLTRLSRSNGTILLRHEPGNEKDSQAVSAYLRTGEKVGYVAAQFLPVVFREVKKCCELSAQLTYMQQNGSTATALLKFESDTSVMAVHLFSRYTPAEVYKANYLHLQWGGIFEPGETDLLATDEQRIYLDRFFALPIDEQNQIAAEWEHRLQKATVENPTNPGRRMTVPLPLSAYDTSWAQLDLTDTALIERIEQDNKVVALYFRYRRTEPGGTMVSPQEFVDEVVKVSAGEELMKRLQEVFDKKMS